MFAYVPIKGMQYCVHTFCNWFGTWKTTAKLWLLPCDCCRKVTVQALNSLKCCKTNQHRRIKGATSMKSYPPQSLLQILHQKLLENNDQNRIKLYFHFDLVYILAFFQMIQNFWFERESKCSAGSLFGHSECVKHHSVYPFSDTKFHQWFL